MSLCLAFPPAARADARSLILGSLPGAESLRLGQYYAHRRNAFWPIMGDLAGADPGLPYEVRLTRLTGAGFALWDVCASATRPGSLDADIRDLIPNDFRRFLHEHRTIALICFNGQTAAKLFERYVAPGLPEELGKIARKTLPSTSPAHAAIRFDRKVELWRAALTPPAAGR